MITPKYIHCEYCKGTIYDSQHNTNALNFFYFHFCCYFIISIETNKTVMMYERIFEKPKVHTKNVQLQALLMISRNHFHLQALVSLDVLEKFFCFMIQKIHSSFFDAVFFCFYKATMLCLM